MATPDRDRVTDRLSHADSRSAEPFGVHSALAPIAVPPRDSVNLGGPKTGVLKTWPCRVWLFTPLLLRLSRLRRTPHPNPPPQGGRGFLGLRRPGESNRVWQQKHVPPPRPFCPFKTDFSSPQGRDSPAARPATATAGEALAVRRPVPAPGRPPRMAHPVERPAHAHSALRVDRFGDRRTVGHVHRDSERPVCRGSHSERGDGHLQRRQRNDRQRDASWSMAWRRSQP